MKSRAPAREPRWIQGISGILKQNRRYRVCSGPVGDNMLPTAPHGVDYHHGCWRSPGPFAAPSYGTHLPGETFCGSRDAGRRFVDFDPLACLPPSPAPNVECGSGPRLVNQEVTCAAAPPGRVRGAGFPYFPDSKSSSVEPVWIFGKLIIQIVGVGVFHALLQ